MIVVVALGGVATAAHAAGCVATGPATLACDAIGAVRLDGVTPEASLGAIEALLAAEAWTVVAVGPPDRTGHRPVRLDAADGSTLQARLVAAGATRAWPGVDAALAEALLAAELVARREGAGGWGRGTWGLVAAVPPPQLEGFAIVRGRVRHAAVTRDFLYLNFGADYRTDTTLRVRLDEARAWGWAAAPERFEGRIVEARGVVFRRGGPMLALDHPLHLRLVD